MRITGIIVAGLMGASPISMPAQSVIQMLGSDLKNVAVDMVGTWASPFRASGKDWLIAAGAIGVSAAVSTWDDDVDRYVVKHAHSAIWSPLRELREGGALNAGPQVTPVIGGVYLLGLALGNRAMRDGVMGCGAAYGAATVVRSQVMYRLVNRQRPDSSRTHVVVAPAAQQGDQYKIGFGSSNWGEESLPAGHVANVMACTSFLAHRFKLGIAEPLVYAVALGVGVGRIVDRRHWTSDTVLGTIFGFAVGKEVARRSRQRADREAHPSSPPAEPGGLSIAPFSGGLAVSWSTRF